MLDFCIDTAYATREIAVCGRACFARAAATDIEGFVKQRKALE